MELKLLQDINGYCIDVLGKLYPHKYDFVHKAAYNHCYMNETFKQNDPNPILRYNNPVPLTGDGNIEMTYLKALIDLQPKSMESALGFTKLVCISTLLNTTLPQACQKCYTQEK